MAKILTGDTYPYIFNTPRDGFLSNIERVPFKTGTRISRTLEGVCLPVKLDKSNIDIIHSFNCLPITSKPFLLSYEGELPRNFNGFLHEFSRNIIFRRLLSNQCKGLYPISEFAKRMFIRHSNNHPLASKIAEKSVVVYPNLPLARHTPRILNEKDITLTFVGKHWGRKGGAIVAKAALLASKKNIKAQFNIVSSLNYGLPIYTDTSKEFYDEYIKLLSLNNVKYYAGLSNIKVMELMSTSDFTLLPTLDDSFGFSILEGMSHGVPAIASNVCAIPEIISHMQNGLLLNLPIDEIGRWKYLYTNEENRGKVKYKNILSETITKSAENIVDYIEMIQDNKVKYEELSDGALQTMKSRFDAKIAASIWQEIYKNANGPSLA